MSDWIRVTEILLAAGCGLFLGWSYHAALRPNAGDDRLARLVHAMALADADMWVTSTHIAAVVGRSHADIYPDLARLETLRLVESDWASEPTPSGHRRRLYRLTPEVPL